MMVMRQDEHKRNNKYGGGEAETVTDAMVMLMRAQWQWGCEAVLGVMVVCRDKYKCNAICGRGETGLVLGAVVMPRRTQWRWDI